MVFWTLLLAALFTMSLLYIIWGPKKVWMVFLNYAILSFLAVLLIHYRFPGLYTYDLIALMIPYLFVIPIHFNVNSIIKHYVLHDDQLTSKFFVALYNRLLIMAWSVFIFLLIGVGLAVLDGFLTQFDPENIWSISVTGIIAVILFMSILTLGYKKRFTFVLVMGKDEKRIFELDSHKSRLYVPKILGVDYVYPRGIFNESGVMKYVYYLDQTIDLKNSGFKPINSDLFEFLKPYIESHDALEEAYNEYIEEKNSI